MFFFSPFNNIKESLKYHCQKSNIKIEISEEMWGVKGECKEGGTVILRVEFRRKIIKPFFEDAFPSFQRDQKRYFKLYKIFIKKVPFDNLQYVKVKLITQKQLFEQIRRYKLC